MRSVSEQDHTQSAVTALNEAFSLLDSVGRGVEEVYENKVHTTGLLFNSV